MNQSGRQTNGQPDCETNDGRQMKTDIKEPDTASQAGRQINGHKRGHHQLDWQTVGDT